MTTKRFIVQENCLLIDLKFNRFVIDFTNIDSILKLDKEGEFWAKNNKGNREWVNIGENKYTVEEKQEIFDLYKLFQRNKYKTKTFQSLLRINPVSEPIDLWEKAEKIISLLEIDGCHHFID